MNADWKTMDSAPLDGTPILVYDPDIEGLMAVCWWTGKCWVRDADLDYLVTDPLAWMERPEPPDFESG